MTNIKGKTSETCKRYLCLENEHASSIPRPLVWGLS